MSAEDLADEDDQDPEGQGEGEPASDEESEGDMVREESLQIGGLAGMRRGSAGPVQDSNALRRSVSFATTPCSSRGSRGSRLTGSMLCGEAKDSCTVNISQCIL